MKIHKIAIDRLRHDPENARLHGTRNLDTIKASLTRFGQQKPVVVDADNTVIAGNGTLSAARALGWTHLACIRTSLKNKEAAAYAIADNRAAELAEWDPAALAKTLGDIDSDADGPLWSTGFDKAELDGLMKKLGMQTPPPPAGIVTVYQIVVSCPDVATQEALYRQLSGQGLKVRAQTL
jgi:hypothetical protein